MNPQHWVTEPIAPRPMHHNEPCEDGARLIRFGRFCVALEARQLLADGRPVRLGGRAFDLLMVLLRARGTLVSKDEIMSAVWPSLVVEEANLRFQMAALRRALGEDRDVIKTVSRRGYLLTAEMVKRSFETDVAGTQAANREPSDGTSAYGSAFRHWQSASPRHRDAMPTVAVIDDDPGVREALEGLLRSAGLLPMLFASVEEFLDRVPQSPPHCLVLDVWLPKRNGLEFHAELARADVKLPVIFISGHADVPMSVSAMKAGAVDFLTKPVHHIDLLNAIRRAIRIASPG